jgi:hypothetical protein
MRITENVAHVKRGRLECYIDLSTAAGEKPSGRDPEAVGGSMRKFAGYPIVINYNLHTQLRYRSTETRLHEAGRYQEERQRSIQTNTTSDSTIENNLWKRELDQYESTIDQCLRKVCGNPVGRMVLGLLNKQTTVWIIPKSDTDLKQCSCSQTWPLNYDIPKDGSFARGVGSGDTVIQFRAELGDDTLFHELVHAYRYSYKKFHPMTISVRSDRLSASQSTEEFLAHQMENIYLSQSHRPLTMDYQWAWVSDKKTIYDFLLENSDMLQTLKYFMRHEYLAMLAAHSFATDYNPFRDYAALEAKFLEGTSLRELPELGTVLKS